MQPSKFVRFIADLAILVEEHLGEQMAETHPDAPAAAEPSSSFASVLASVFGDLDTIAREYLARRPARGRDLEADLEVNLFQMMTGATVPLTLDARTVLVHLPIGVADGATLKLPAQGGAGSPPGDLHVRVRLQPHPEFERDGDRIRRRVPPEAPTREPTTGQDFPAAPNLSGVSRELALLLTVARQLGKLPERGRDVEAELEVDFFQMLTGATVPLTLEDRAVQVPVPIGVEDGATLTLSAQGGRGNPPGDLHVRVRLRPHPDFERDGDHIKMRVPVPPEALALERLNIQTPTGPQTVPFTAEHLGHTLRFTGEGIAPDGRDPGDLLIDLDPGPLLAAPIDEFPSAASAFSALRTLCPGAREHLTNLVDRAHGRDIRDVLWALAVAHERGLRAPIRGLATELVQELVKYGSLRPYSWTNRRSHVFTWMGGKSPLVSREQILGSSCLLWTLHLDRLADEAHWSHAGAAITHH